MNKIKIDKRTIILVVVLFASILLSCFVSYIKFGVANPVSSGIGLVKILFTDTQYAEIQHSPRVILAKQGSDFTDFAQSEGYTLVDRMGSLYVIEKDGIRATVASRANGYYSRWIWGK